MAYFIVILVTIPPHIWCHSSLGIFITATISWDLYLVANSKLVLILHCPFSFVGPYIFLNIFLSHVINIFSILFVSIKRNILTNKINREVLCRSG